jgi:hypothetical protein
MPALNCVTSSLQCGERASSAAHVLSFFFLVVSISKLLKYFFFKSFKYFIYLNNVWLSYFWKCFAGQRDCHAIAEASGCRLAFSG